LSGPHLEQEHRKPHQHQGDDIGDEECTSAIPVAEVGEPPYVAESNGKTEAREEKLDGTVPVAAIKAGRVLR
jgi:hypothetical protein